MSTYILAANEPSSILRNALCVEIYQASDSPFASPVNIWMTADRLDQDCKRLSLAMPGATLRVVVSARILAVYKDGGCTEKRSIRDFYSGISDEEFARTQF